MGGGGRRALSVAAGPHNAASMPANSNPYVSSSPASKSMRTLDLLARTPLSDFFLALSALFNLFGAGFK